MKIQVFEAENLWGTAYCSRVQTGHWLEALDTTCNQDQHPSSRCWLHVGAMLIKCSDFPCHLLHSLGQGITGSKIRAIGQQEAERIRAVLDQFLALSLDATDSCCGCNQSLLHVGDLSWNTTLERSRPYARPLYSQRPSSGSLQGFPIPSAVTYDLSKA